MREEVEGRPLAILAIGFSLGLIALVLPISIPVLVALVVWIRPLPIRILLASAFLFGVVIAPSVPETITSRKALHLEGRVVSIPRSRHEKSSVDFVFESSGSLYRMSSTDQIGFGDTLRVTGVEQPIANTELSKFQGIHSRIVPTRLEVLTKSSGLFRFASSWRESFFAFVESTMPQQDAQLVEGICFGSTFLSDTQIYEDLKKSGLVHIVSVSGLQVFVLAYLLQGCLRFLPIPRWFQVVLLILLLSAYAIACGLTPAVVRATIMSILGMSAFLFSRRPDALSALCLAVVAYLLWSPHSIWSPGFQLSTIAILGVVLFSQWRPDRGSGSRSFLVRQANEFLRLNLILSAACIPLSAYYFGSVALASLPANLLVCWTLPILVAAAFFSHLLYLFSHSVGEAFVSLIVTPTINWTHLIMNWAGNGVGLFSVPDFSGYLLLAYYVAWIMIYRRRIDQP